MAHCQDWAATSLMSDECRRQRKRGPGVIGLSSHRYARGDDGHIGITGSPVSRFRPRSVWHLTASPIRRGYLTQGCSERRTISRPHRAGREEWGRLLSRWPSQPFLPLLAPFEGIGGSDRRMSCSRMTGDSFGSSYSNGARTALPLWQIQRVAALKG